MTGLSELSCSNSSFTIGSIAVSRPSARQCVACNGETFGGYIPTVGTASRSSRAFFFRNQCMFCARFFRGTGLVRSIERIGSSASPSRDDDSTGCRHCDRTPWIGHLRCTGPRQKTLPSSLHVAPYTSRARLASDENTPNPKKTPSPALRLGPHVRGVEH